MLPGGGGKYAGRGGAQKRSRVPEILVVVLVLGLFGGLLSWRSDTFRQRVLSLSHHDGDASSLGDIKEAKARLTRQIEAYNERMRLADMESEQIPLARPCTASASAADDDKKPADTRYMMQPASEVAKEAPALAKALAEHSKDREIMLTLANGVMICKNTSLCW